MATCRSISACCIVFSVLAILASLVNSQGSGTQLTQNPENCTAFNATACHVPELAHKVYCLRNGSTIKGFCAAQEAACQKGLQFEKDSTICTSTTRGTSGSTSRTPFIPGGSAKGSFNTEESTIDTDKDAAPSLHMSRLLLVLGFISTTYASYFFVSL